MLRPSALALVLFGAGAAWAQDVSDPDPQLRDAVVPAVTYIEFGGATVAATVARPDGVVTVEPRPTEFPRLVHVRTDFSRELNGTVALAR